MTKLSYIFAGLAAAFMLWFLLSYIDIVSDNLTENPKHSDLNALILLVEYMEDKQ